MLTGSDWAFLVRHLCLDPIRVRSVGVLRGFPKGLLLPAIVLFYVLLIFVKQYRSAWLKMIGIVAYIAAILLTAVQIIVTRIWPETTEQILILFNCAGQLIAATGILDSVQHLYILSTLKSHKKTNMMFLKIWLFAVVVGLIPYAFAIPGVEKSKRTPSINKI